MYIYMYIATIMIFWHYIAIDFRGLQLNLDNK